MFDLATSDISRKIVEEVEDVQPGEHVVVLTDPEKVDIARSIASAAKAAGATTVLTVKPILDAHGNELPKTVAASMKEADLMVDVNTHAITHTNARREASEAGTRYLTLRGVTKEMMLSGAMDADYEYINEINRVIADIHTNAESAHVTSPEGTDITVDLTGRKSLFDLDGYQDPGFTALPQAKSGMTPVEGSGQGTIVFDYSFDRLGLLDEPMTLTIEDGRVTDIEGGSKAAELREILDNADEGARNLAEAPALGTNPDIELTGNQATDKKKLGVVNFAVGDNVSLGGTVESDIHLDGIILNGTVWFDGEKVIEDGEFLEDAAIELAETYRSSAE